MQTVKHMESKPRNGPGPMAEIEYWTDRSYALTSMYEQLQSSLIQLTRAVMHAALSTGNHPYLKKKINDLDYEFKELTRHYTEAKDNVKFLATLERHFKNLARAKTFAAAAEGLASMMNVRTPGTETTP